MIQELEISSVLVKYFNIELLLKIPFFCLWSIFPQPQSRTCSGVFARGVSCSGVAAQPHRNGFGGGGRDGNSSRFSEGVREKVHNMMMIIPEQRILGSPSSSGTSKNSGHQSTFVRKPKAHPSSGGRSSLPGLSLSSLRFLHFNVFL